MMLPKENNPNRQPGNPGPRTEKSGLSSIVEVLHAWEGASDQAAKMDRGTFSIHGCSITLLLETGGVAKLFTFAG